MDYKKARIVSFGFFIAAIAAAFLLYTFSEMSGAAIAIMVISLTLLVCGFVVVFKFYRCPHCRELLPTRTWKEIVCCPQCGKKLDEQK